MDDPELEAGRPSRDGSHLFSYGPVSTPLSHPVRAGRSPVSTSHPTLYLTYFWAELLSLRTTTRAFTTGRPAVSAAAQIGNDIQLFHDGRDDYLQRTLNFDSSSHHPFISTLYTKSFQPFTINFWAELSPLWTTSRASPSKRSAAAAAQQGGSNTPQQSWA
eukprot:7384121-Prymnesium_polylepis.1